MDELKTYSRYAKRDIKDYVDSYMLLIKDKINEAIIKKQHHTTIQLPVNGFNITSMNDDEAKINIYYKLVRKCEGYGLETSIMKQNNNVHLRLSWMFDKDYNKKIEYLDSKTI
jgi:hypothetical protein